MPELVLTRREAEAIVIDGPCVVRVERIKGSRVQIRVVADAAVTILRAEIRERAA